MKLGDLATVIKIKYIKMFGGSYSVSQKNVPMPRITYLP